MFNLIFLITFHRNHSTNKAMQINLASQIILIWSLIFIVTLGQAQSIEEKISPFDTVFQPAINSPTYVVASKDQVNSLKVYFENELTKHIDEIELNKEQINQLNNSLDSLLTVTSQYKPVPVAANKSNILIISIGINVILFIIFIVIFLGGLQMRKVLKEGKDSYVNLEKEFDLHKKNAIERERKLMRKIIDLQNEMEKSSDTEI